MRERFRRLFARLAWLIPLLFGGLAQAEASFPQGKSADRTAPTVKLRGADLHGQELNLGQRQRDFLHPGDPHDLVGIEEGGNGFRERTPLLVGADTSAVQVDPEENYRRRLALYEDRASFHTPLPRAGGSAARGTGGRASAQTPADAAPPSGAGLPFSLILWLALAILAGTLGWRYRYHLIP